VSGASAAARSAGGGFGGGFHTCSGTHGLIAVGHLAGVSAKAACKVWGASADGHLLIRCHGKPLTLGTYQVVTVKVFRGWHVSEGRRALIRFRKGPRSFVGGGQDTPPYPCV
jgi:hypothetical protein